MITEVWLKLDLYTTEIYRTIWLIFCFWKQKTGYKLVTGVYILFQLLVILPSRKCTFDVHFANTCSIKQDSGCLVKGLNKLHNLFNKIRLKEQIIDYADMNSNSNESPEV